MQDNGKPWRPPLNAFVDRPPQVAATYHRMAPKGKEGGREGTKECKGTCTIETPISCPMCGIDLGGVHTVPEMASDWLPEWLPTNLNIPYTMPGVRERVTMSCSFPYYKAVYIPIFIDYKNSWFRKIQVIYLEEGAVPVVCQTPVPCLLVPRNSSWR